MTVAANYEPVLVAADGVEVDYDFDFEVLTENDLAVALVLKTDSTDVTGQEISTHYTVTISASTRTGTITFLVAPADTYYVSIRRSVTASQPTNIPAGGLFREQQIENALDRIVMIIQNLSEAIDRAILSSEYSGETGFTFPAPEASKVIGWNSDADGLENYDNAADAVTAAEAAQTAAELAQDGAETAETNAAASALAAAASAASTSGSYTIDFDDDDLESGILTVEHNLGQKYVNFTIYDNNDKMILPDEATATDEDTLTIDLTSYGTISGTWNIRVGA